MMATCRSSSLCVPDVSLGHLERDLMHTDEKACIYVYMDKKSSLAACDRSVCSDVKMDEICVVNAFCMLCCYVHVLANGGHTKAIFYSLFSANAWQATDGKKRVSRRKNRVSK
jgi:hypothetical protein